jgi:hypothetical protein
VLAEDRENDLDEALSVSTKQPFTLIHRENRPMWLPVAAGDLAPSGALDSAPTCLRPLTADQIRTLQAQRLSWQPVERACEAEPERLNLLGAFLRRILAA